MTLWITKLWDLILKACLRTIYLAETKNFLLKVL